MVVRREQGLVIRVTGHEVRVQVGDRVVPCLLRGRHRQKGQEFQVVAGDRVDVSMPSVEGEHGAIEEMVPRESWLSRFHARDGTERVIVANVDILFVVVSVRSPAYRFAFVDRVLVSAERGQTDAWICLNKMDLVGPDDTVSEFISTYTEIGYPVIRTSVKTGEGIDQLRSMFTGGVYAFVGQSGVGKTSLLNTIDDTLDLRVARVAGKTGRGRHTTTYSQLFPIGRGYMADTPGMQTFGFPGTEVTELSLCFPEFHDIEEECRFQPCTHSHEPGCAVKHALARRRVRESRYQSYLMMLEEIAERKKRY